MKDLAVIPLLLLGCSALNAASALAGVPLLLLGCSKAASAFAVVQDTASEFSAISMACDFAAISAMCPLLLLLKGVSRWKTGDAARLAASAFEIEVTLTAASFCVLAVFQQQLPLWGLRLGPPRRAWHLRLLLF